MRRHRHAPHSPGSDRGFSMRTVRLPVAAILSVIALVILLATPWGLAASLLALASLVLVWGQHRTEGDANEYH